jgi:hypothetical protein
MRRLLLLVLRMVRRPPQQEKEVRHQKKRKKLLAQQQQQQQPQMEAMPYTPPIQEGSPWPSLLAALCIRIMAGWSEGGRLFVR